MKEIDWKIPQRQPISGLIIVFLNSIWEVFKSLWPFLLFMLLGNNEGRVNKYEIMGLGFLVITILHAILKFAYFRFYINEDKLIIKSGWFKKETKFIPIEKIQSVHIEQGPLHQLLKIVKLSIDTAGSQKAEASIDAMHKSMAEALKKQIESEKTDIIIEEQKTELKETVTRLSDKDLMKLSISANHFEAFLILLSFGYGLYENLSDLDNNIFSGIRRQLPANNLYPLLFLIVAILIITILVSTARIFFRFYDHTVFKTGKGYQIKSGLLNVKEKLIAFRKIQFVSWKANWIRKKLGLWILEYHVAGADELKQNVRVHIPVTQRLHIGLLVKNYFELPDTQDRIAVRIHSSYITRTLLVFGLLPALIVIPLLWLAWSQYALLFLIYPMLILITSYYVQKKFRLWALEDIMFVSRGSLGEKKIILQWHKLQSVQISQTLFQRKNNLANLKIQTAGGNVRIPFIPLSAARQLANFALYKTASSKDSWA